jgi:hypothetical protein
LSRLNWGGLLIGATAGLGSAAALSVILFAVGLRFGESAGGDVVFALVQFVGLLVAGFVGGRFSPGDAPAQTTHGAISALLLFGLTAAIAMAAGSDVATLAILGGGVVALVLGSAGGALSVRR